MGKIPTRALGLILVASLLTAGSGLAYVAERLSDLSGLVSTLREDNSRLLARNRTLTKRLRHTKTRVTRRHKRLARRLMARVGRKLARATATMVPFAGLAAGPAFAALEIKEYCDEIEEMKAFDRELFGETAIGSGSDQGQKVCGIDAQAELEAMVREEMSEAGHWFSETYDRILAGIREGPAPLGTKLHGDPALH